MVIYPYNSAQFLTEDVFVQNGGKTGTFSQISLNNSFLIAEMQASKYIGTLLQPTIVTGTFNYLGSQRIVTDYGYVSNLLSVNILSQDAFSTSCDLIKNSSCAFIWKDTYGYVDMYQVLSVAGLPLAAYFTIPYPTFPPSFPFTYNYSMPYQFELVYQCGLPTGTTMSAPIMEALTILAQIDLNEKDPGNAGMNESTGDVGVDDFRSLDYYEKRHTSAMRMTNFGSSPMANRAARLIDSTIRKARPVYRL